MLCDWRGLVTAFASRQRHELGRCSHITLSIKCLCVSSKTFSLRSEKVAILVASHFGQFHPPDVATTASSCGDVFTWLDEKKGDIWLATHDFLLIKCVWELTNVRGISKVSHTHAVEFTKVCQFVNADLTVSVLEENWKFFYHICFCISVIYIWYKKKYLCVHQKHIRKPFIYFFLVCGLWIILRLFWLRLYKSTMDIFRITKKINK